MILLGFAEGCEDGSIIATIKNLVPDALGLMCDRIYCRRLLLEEYSLKIVYIKD